MISIFSLDEDGMRDNPQTLAAARDLAGEIAREANQTSAKIGITTVEVDGKIRIGPRGAAAVPTEVGTRRLSARRHVKNALDKRRIR